MRRFWAGISAAYAFNPIRLVGRFRKDPSGGVSFQYDHAWLAWRRAIPVSLSLHLREDAWRGAPVVAVFGNLLPDSVELRRRIAENVVAQGTEAYGLLAEIGRDCVNALQFVPNDSEMEIGPPGSATGVPIDNTAIEALLKGLKRAPLGRDHDQDFRISIAGAQEKTALLRHEGLWFKPLGTTPTA